MQLHHHYSILLYPFQHDLTGKPTTTKGASQAVSAQLASRYQALQGLWEPWWRRVEGQPGGIVGALDDTFFFLPYARNLIFPEVTALAEVTPDRQANELSEKIARPLDQWVKNLHECQEDGVVRLTCSEQRLREFHSMHLCVQRDASVEYETDFEVDWIDVFLFPQQIGFLAIKIHLPDPDADIDKFKSLMDTMEKVHPPHTGWVLPTLEARALAARPFPVRLWIEFLLQGFVSDAPVNRTMLKFMEELDESKCYTNRDFAQVYGATMTQFNYACINAGGKSAMPTKDFRQLLYELCADARFDLPDHRPDRLYYNKVMETSLIAIWDNWTGLSLADRTIFLGRVATDFTLTALPHNIEADYLPVFLYVMFQKIWLSKRFGDAKREGNRLSTNMRKARQLWEDFLLFQSSYWFPELTYKPQGIHLYRRFRDALNVGALYAQLQEQIRELRSHYERKGEERLSNMVTVLTIGGLLLALVGIAAQLYGPRLLEILEPVVGVLLPFLY